MDTLIPGFIGLTLFGLIAAYFGRLLWLGRCSRSWPVVEGTITRSRIREWQGAKGGHGHRKMCYAPDVEYEYTIRGEQRVGRVVCFGRTWNTNHQSAQQTVEEYPLGGLVRVHHHPNKPQLATLETRASSRASLFALLAGGMSAAILWGMLAGC